MDLNKPSWDDAPEWANWLVGASIGVWAWFENEPEPGISSWRIPDGMGERATKSTERFLNWRDLKEKRPEPKFETFDPNRTSFRNPLVQGPSSVTYSFEGDIAKIPPRTRYSIRCPADWAFAGMAEYVSDELESTGCTDEVKFNLNAAADFFGIDDLPPGRIEPLPERPYPEPTPFDVPGYEKLADVLAGAYDQAARGKGKERHANDLPFHEQPMQQISDLFDSPAGMAYQVAKKVQEALNMPTFDRQERELFGAINYVAGIIIWLQKQPRVEEPTVPYSSTKHGMYLAEVDQLLRKVAEYSGVSFEELTKDPLK